MTSKSWIGKLLCLIFAFFFIALYSAGCPGNSEDGDDDNSAQSDDTAPDDTLADDDSDGWQPVEPHKEMVDRFRVVWLAGTPYEMGVQQGELLHEELAAGIEWLNSMAPVGLIVQVAKALGLVDLAMNNSYPDIIEECRGLTDAAGDVGWTMDICILLNFGDVVVEFVSTGFPSAMALMPGCSEAAARGGATADGRLYHGRILDWSQIDYLLDYPVIFVRQPSDGIPHAFIGFPANLSPYSGINAEGLTIGSNEADPLDNTAHDRVGRSHVQMIAQLLKNAHSLDEAEQMIVDMDHMSVELIMVADGKAQDAAVFEMSAKAIGVRHFADDVLWATNHFVAPETDALDADPASESSMNRFERWSQLLPPGGQDTRYGEIDPAVMIEMMRDRVDPWTHEEYPEDAFDNNSAIATNGALFEVLFDPEKLFFWVAAGAIPVPQQPFIGFSLGELLDLPGAVPVEPAVYE